MPHRDLDPTAAKAALDADPALRILDVRTQPEHARHRVDGSMLLPIQELARRIGELDPDSSYLVICQHGVRSVAACEFLSERGFESLTNVIGGMAAWIADGLPHVTG